MDIGYSGLGWIQVMWADLDFIRLGHIVFTSVKFRSIGVTPIVNLIQIFSSYFKIFDQVLIKPAWPNQNPGWVMMIHIFSGLGMAQANSDRIKFEWTWTWPDPTHLPGLSGTHSSLYNLTPLHGNIYPRHCSLNCAVLGSHMLQNIS